MAANKRNAAKIEADRVEIMRLWVSGVPQYQIAQRMEMTPEMVHYDINAVKKRWAESQIFDFNVQMQAELARLDKIEYEAWAAWERSKRPRVIHKVEGHYQKTTTDFTGFNGPQAPMNSVEKERYRGKAHQTAGAAPAIGDDAPQEREGTASFLDTVLKCVELRCKLLRLLDPAMVVTVDTIKLYAGFDMDKV